MKTKSVASINPCKSLPCRQAGVIQTSYDIVKAHGGEIDVKSTAGKGLQAEALAEAGTEFKILMPI